MFRIWGKIIKNNKLIQDKVLDINNLTISKFNKIELCIDNFCEIFDLSRPIWLPSNTKDISLFNKTRFYADNFIDVISFDYFEIEIIEEN